MKRHVRDPGLRADLARDAARVLRAAPPEAPMARLHYLLRKRGWEGGGGFKRADLAALAEEHELAGGLV